MCMSFIPGGVVPKTSQMVHAISLLSIHHLCGVKRTEPADGQPLTVVFTVLVRLGCPNAIEMKTSAAIFSKSGEGRIFDFLRK